MFQPSTCPPWIRSLFWSVCILRVIPLVDLPMEWGTVRKMPDKKSSENCPIPVENLDKGTPAWPQRWLSWMAWSFLEKPQNQLMSSAWFSPTLVRVSGWWGRRGRLADSRRTINLTVEKQKYELCKNMHGVDLYTPPPKYKHPLGTVWKIVIQCSSSFKVVSSRDDQIRSSWPQPYEPFTRSFRTS